MWAWTNPLADNKVREENDYPLELVTYRLVALTGWDEEQIGRQRARFINDLSTMDEIVRTNDRMVLAKMVAIELAQILAPMFGARVG